MTSFGKRLKLRRTECGISQVELAKSLGMHQSIVGKYEREIVTPPIEVIKKIAGLLDTTLAYLMGIDDSAPTVRDNAMAKRLDDLMMLPDSEREHVLFMLDAVLRDAKARKTYAMSA